MDYASLPPTLTLKDVVALLSMSRGHAWNLLARKQFPIKTINKRGWHKFSRADVIAYHRDGIETNPLLTVRNQRFFQSARRAVLASKLSPREVA